MTDITVVNDCHDALVTIQLNCIQTPPNPYYHLPMSFFTGTAGPKRKVALGGKSRAEETREQVLERTRLEREKRQRSKLEQKSALLIQACWRQHRTATQYAQQLREEWIQAYGGQQGCVGQLAWRCMQKCLGTNTMLSMQAEF